MVGERQLLQSKQQWSADTADETRVKDGSLGVPEAEADASARRPSQKNANVGLIAGLFLGTLTVAATASWLISRRQEQDLAERTRERLRRGEPRHILPTAADIQVR